MLVDSEVLAKPAAPAKICLRRELTTRDLTLFGIVCLIGIRWYRSRRTQVPEASCYGCWRVLFGAPLAVAVAALMSKYPGHGGLYTWTRNDFGPAHGFMAFWVYWIGIAFLFPGAAVFYISSSAYTFGHAYAHLADSRIFIVCGSLAAVWIALGSNLIGLKTGKWTENCGAIAVAMLGLLLIVAAAVALEPTRFGHGDPFEAQNGLERSIILGDDGIWHHRGGSISE